MALGVLMVTFIVLFIIAVVLQILLYRRQNKSNNGIFIINMLFGIVLSYLAFTSFPSNYTGQRSLALVFGLVAVLALVLKFTNRKFIFVSKVMLTVTIIGTLVQLFS